MITESNIMEKGKHNNSITTLILNLLLHFLYTINRDYQPYQSHDDDNNQLKVDERNKGTVPPNNTIRITAIGVSIVILLILSTILIIIVIALIWSYKRRSAKQKLCTDCSYSTLSRASGPQTRTRSTQENSSELYDQIHLSPSTGQTEYIPKSENINNPFTTPQTDSHPIYSTAGEEIAEHSSTLNATSQETSSQLPLQIAHESTNEQPTYAAIDKSKKKKFKAGEKELPVSSYAGHSSSAQKEKENTTKQDIRSPHTIVNEELYTAVKKKEKVCEPKDEEEAPPIPPHTVEELYAAVQKKPKGRSNADCDHNIPSLTKEEMHVAGEKPLQNTTEDPYTAVMKNPKDGSTENYTETAPPIPPHTVEELYTAVMKTSKNGAEDEEKAPPKFSCTVEMILDKH